MGLLALSLSYVFAARAIPLDVWSLEETINSRTLPTLYGLLLIGVLIRLLFKRPPDVEHPQRLTKAVGNVALLVLFAAAVPFVGLWLSLACLLVPSLIYMGERRIWLVATISLGLPVTGWLLIEQLLGVFVPGPFS